jgi:hypothetical protein
MKARIKNSPFVTEITDVAYGTDGVFFGYRDDKGKYYLKDDVEFPSEDDFEVSCK